MSEMIVKFHHDERGIATSWDEVGKLVRCRNCKHWDTTWQNDFAPNYHYCPLIDGTRRDDFYCADAED